MLWNLRLSQVTQACASAERCGNGFWGASKIRGSARAASREVLYRQGRRLADAERGLYASGTVLMLSLLIRVILT